MDAYIYHYRSSIKYYVAFNNEINVSVKRKQPNSSTRYNPPLFLYVRVPTVP